MIYPSDMSLTNQNSEIMKKDLKQVRPEDFDVEALMAAAREGRLYVDEGINQVCSEQVVEDVRANVARIPEGEIGPDDVSQCILTPM